MRGSCKTLGTQASRLRLEFVHFDHVKHVIVIEIEKEACLSGTRSNALKGRSITAQGKAQRAAALGR